MNPFTRFLNQWSRNRRLSEFIAQWDALEQLVVQVYREKRSVVETKPEFDRIWPWLRNHYGEWEEQLRPYWQRTQAAGQPTQTDPFLLILRLQEPQEIVGDWTIMQHLPAAREALNKYLRDQT